MGNRKNKSQKVGKFLSSAKPPHNTPQKSRNPPQTHHIFTTTKHRKFAKPPAKTTLSLPKNIFCKTIPLLTLFAIKADKDSGTPHR